MSNADGGLDAAWVFPKIFDLLHEGEGGEESIRPQTKSRPGGQFRGNGAAGWAAVLGEGWRAEGRFGGRPSATTAC